MAEAICYGPQPLCTFSVDVSKMQDSDHSSARPFLRVVFAASNLEGQGNLPSWIKSRLSSSFFRAAPPSSILLPKCTRKHPQWTLYHPMRLRYTRNWNTRLSHKSQQNFLNGSLRVKEIKPKINKWNLIKLKSFLHSKRNHQQNEKTIY